jgi:hypothetical protein
MGTQKYEASKRKRESEKEETQLSPSPFFRRSLVTHRAVVVPENRWRQLAY